MQRLNCGIGTAEWAASRMGGGSRLEGAEAGTKGASAGGWARSNLAGWLPAVSNRSRGNQSVARAKTARAKVRDKRFWRVSVGGWRVVAGRGRDGRGTVVRVDTRVVQVLTVHMYRT